jgi:hypothetical protein
MRRAILAGIMLAPVAAIAWIVAREHVPDLEPEEAALIISSTPEFNHARSLLKVAITTRAVDSAGDFYHADFTFTDLRSGTTLKAEARFRYWSKRWHLREFYYGEPTNRETIEIKSDPDPAEEFSK